jgi:hypothetical protein
MKPIEMERIEAIPETRLCLDHAVKVKKYGGEFVMSATHDRTSKAGSLKKNFGGVSTKLSRNDRAIERLKDDFDEEKWKTAT